MSAHSHSHGNRDLVKYLLNAIPYIIGGILLIAVTGILINAPWGNQINKFWSNTLQDIAIIAEATFRIITIVSIVFIFFTIWFYTDKCKFKDEKRYEYFWKLYKRNYVWITILALLFFGFVGNDGNYWGQWLVASVVFGFFSTNHIPEIVRRMLWNRTPFEEEAPHHDEHHH